MSSLANADTLTRPIRVFLADGQPVVLEGLRSVLLQYPALQVVGDAGDAPDVIEKVIALEPDVVLLDPRLPRAEGLEVLRGIQTRAPKSKVILFAAADHKDDFVEAMK